MGLLGDLNAANNSFLDKGTLAENNSRFTVLEIELQDSTLEKDAKQWIVSIRLDDDLTDEGNPKEGKISFGGTTKSRNKVLAGVQSHIETNGPLSDVCVCEKPSSNPLRSSFFFLDEWKQDVELKLVAG